MGSWSRTLPLIALLLAGACRNRDTLGTSCPLGYVECAEGCCKQCESGGDGIACVDCTPGTLQCWPDPTPRGGGSILVDCDADGNIANVTPCSFGCSLTDATCDECYAGETYCSGDQLVACSDAGTIDSTTSCTPYACREAAESGRCEECTPSAIECHGDDLVTCDGEGRILASAPCAVGCSIEAMQDDRCNACDPGTTLCTGNTSIVCTPDGFVATTTDCNDLTDDCNSGVCTSSGCQAMLEADDTPCQSADFCTTGQSCQAGVCVGGSPRDCDDGIPCTADACDEFFDTCVNNTTVLNGVPCDDGLFCTIASTCSAGICTNAIPNDCDDNDPCTADSCDATSGACVNDTAAANGTACDDGFLCTVLDSCLGGTCSGAPNPCDDGDACTADSCDVAQQACVNDAGALVGATCDDGLFCTENDTCDAAQGCIGTPNLCDDFELCTVDSCNDVANVCVNDPVAANGIPCDDGLFCNIGERCDAGACTGGVAPSCNDGNPCTADSCTEGAGGCLNDSAAAESNVCADGLFCTIGDICTGGTCVAGGPRPCNDGNACTIDSCDEVGDTCIFDFSTTDGVGCDDGLFCTLGTACNIGICGGGFANDCDDAKPCTLDSCDESGSGTCINDQAVMQDQFCGSFQLCCNGACIPSDETNCGECGNACGPMTGTVTCTGPATCFRNTCIDAGILVITEMLIDPFVPADTQGEWIEVFNPTARDIDIGGWNMYDDGSDFHTISTALPVIVPAGGYALLVRNNSAAVNCGLAGDYQYSSFTLGNNGDEVVFEVAGCEVDRFDYPAGFDATGAASNLGFGTLDAVLNDNTANWCDAVTPMDCGDLGTPGLDNRTCP